MRLFEGLALRKDTVVATEQGILEKGSDGMVTLLRVRPHRDAELQVVVSPDRMKATLSHIPSEGDGAMMSVDDARARIGQAGVRKGIDEPKLLAALDMIARGEPFSDFPFAAGRKPKIDAQKRILFHVHLASGKAVSLRADGRADFRAQDRISRVNKGEKIATVHARDPLAEDGWDVTGAALTLPPEAQETLQAGRGVREDLQIDGSILFTAEASGELIRDGVVLSIMEAHAVEGDVGMAHGQHQVSRQCPCRGLCSVGFHGRGRAASSRWGRPSRPRCSPPTAPSPSRRESRGKARRSCGPRRTSLSMFAEQSALLAIGDVHLRGPCVRCQVKCNGRLLLDSEKGTLVGGEVRASRGAEVQNIGSPGGVATIVSFGQDFLVKDQIEREEREVAALTQKVAELDAEMFVLEKRAAVTAAAAGPVSAQSQAAAMLGRSRAQKLQAMKLIEQRKLRLITLRDRYDEHVASEIVVRGTLYPGVVLESHGRRWETRTEKKMITLQFDPTQGQDRGEALSRMPRGTAAARMLAGVPGGAGRIRRTHARVRQFPFVDPARDRAIPPHPVVRAHVPRRLCHHLPSVHLAVEKEPDPGAEGLRARHVLLGHHRPSGRCAAFCRDDLRFQRLLLPASAADHPPVLPGGRQDPPDGDRRACRTTADSSARRSPSSPISR